MAYYDVYDVLLRGDQRNLGLYIAGMPGGGKTTLIQNLALADIRNGLGVCIIDPTGGLLEGLIHHLPLDRGDNGEIILFDTSDPIPIDFFSYQDRDERRVLTDMIVSMFELADTKLLKPLLMEELGTLFDANDNKDIPDRDRCTLLDLAYFLKDPDRRRTILEYVPSRKASWAWLDKVKNPDAEFESILRRLTYYLEPGPLNVMFSAKRPKLNIARIMAENKVLLVNLLDTESDQFIASLITAKFQQATFGRRNIHPSKRDPYYLYVDECHTVLKFAEKDFNALLTRSRQFQLCLILANQFPSDLPESIHSKLRVLQASILFRNIPDYLTPFRSAFPRPVPSPRYPQERRDRLVEKQNEIALEVQSLWREFDTNDETYGEFFKPNQLPRLNQQSLAIQREIKELDEEHEDALAAAVPDYMHMITKLDVGEAICIPVNGQPFGIKTPDPLEKHDRDGCAEYLRIRTVEKYACEPPEKEHAVSSSLHDADIPPDKPPSVPPNRNKA